MPHALRRYFSALYCYTVQPIDGEAVHECIYPDWAALHYVARGPAPVVTLGHELPDKTVAQPSPAFMVNGPTSVAMQLQTGELQTWSVAISPLGWARFIDTPANALANKLIDGSTHPAFAGLAPILDIVRQDGSDRDTVAQRVIDRLASLPSCRNGHDAEIAALHEALCDPETADVEALVGKVSVSRRTLERISSRYFGFPPKTLLRRQRFVRSLGKFSIDPARGWSASLDPQYVDQAHFVRDFRSFMGMTPSQYAQMPHPVLESIFNRRLAEQAGQ